MICACRLFRVLAATRHAQLACIFALVLAAPAHADGVEDFYKGRSLTLIVGHSPLRTIPELREYQQFMNEFVAAVRDAKQSGKSADDAAAAINLGAKYKDYQNTRYRAAVQAIYDELGK